MRWWGHPAFAAAATVCRPDAAWTCDSGDMWAPLDVSLAMRSNVVTQTCAAWLSSHPETGYDKKTRGAASTAFVDKLQIDKVDLVTHDIGNMVGYAFVSQYPDRVTPMVVMMRRWPASVRRSSSHRSWRRISAVQAIDAGREVASHLSIAV